MVVTGECAAASAGNDYDEHGVAGDNSDNGDGAGGGDNGDGGDGGGVGGGGDGYPSPLPQLGLRPTHSPPENVQVRAISFFNVLKAKPPSHTHYTPAPWKLCNLYVDGKFYN